MESTSTMFLKLVLVLELTWLSLASSTSIVQTKPGCQAKCGNITIPYPFGINHGCSIDEILGYEGVYSINCDTSYDPPKPFIGGSNYEITSISDSEVRVRNMVATECFNESGSVVLDRGKLTINFTDTPYMLSHTKNQFFAIGCASAAEIIVQQSDLKYTNQTCQSVCHTRERLLDGSCTGSGCCQTKIPKGTSMYIAKAHSFNNHSKIWSYDPCSYAFVGEQDKYTFSASDLQLDPAKFNAKAQNVPLVLDWAVEMTNCEKAKKNETGFACKANSYCVDADNNPGYRCVCDKGYKGNPYLDPGCQDVNECEDINTGPCDGVCTNTDGSYTCSCPKGSKGDGRKDGSGCVNTKVDTFSILKIVLGIGSSLLLLLVSSSWVFLIIRKRKLKKLKEKFFEQNGGLLLKQKLSSHGSGVESGTIFTAQELRLATNNYHKSRIIGHGGYGTVYKGTLSRDNRTVAIKKSKIADESQNEQFINEIVILTQVNHRNVVKLLGCCLETEVPLLVYEFVSNGTLSEHIHTKGGISSSISWESRLKIATETSSALAYLHSETSAPIIHRDIKSANILLDENYVAKVSDFGASRLVPLYLTHLDTLVQGTLGYLDPEYYHTSQLTEKSDVYSFGVVLVELLTGEKPICFERSEERRNITTSFISSIEENTILQFLDARVVNEGKPEEVLAVVKIAKRCLNSKGQHRPTMKQVASDLEGLRKLETTSEWDRHEPTQVEKTNSQSEPTDLYDVPLNYDSSIFDSRQYSLQSNVTSSMRNP